MPPKQLQTDSSRIPEEASGSHVPAGNMALPLMLIVTSGLTYTADQHLSALARQCHVRSVQVISSSPMGEESRWLIPLSPDLPGAERFCCAGDVPADQQVLCFCAAGLGPAHQLSGW